MKKQFGKLFIIFGVILCIFALVGCDLVLGNNPETEKKPAEESSSETFESSEETTDKSDGKDTEATDPADESDLGEESSDSEETLADVFEPDEELMEALVDYLQNIMTNYEVPESSISMDIDKIKDGEQPLQLKFDPEKYYYVCAYYSPEHLEEKYLYCCAEEYTWVGFSNEKNIAEYYNGVKLCAAFQINRTELCIDLLPSNRKVPKVENFQLYTPVFEDGVNIASVIEYKDTFIYLNSSDSSSVYFCSKHILHDFNSMPLIELDGKSYITESLYVDTPGEDYEDDIRWRFGEYYDLLMEMMITDKYSVVHKSGKTIYYGLFEIEKFIDMIFK